MTHSRSRFLIALTGAAILLLGACGGNGSQSASLSSNDKPAWSQGAVPTAEQLASVLVTADDFDGTWTVNVPPDSQMATPGVVPDTQQDLLPKIELCDKASEESRTAAEALRWQAFRQLDQSEENPIDMAAGDRVGHMIFVQEYLMSGDPAEVEKTFNALRDGMRACQGKIPAGEEGPGKAEPMTIPDVGDDRYGDLTTLAEAGGGAYWLLHNSLVRQGPVLMDLQVVDIVMGKGVQPTFTTTDVGSFLTTAVEKLPSPAGR
jgi:hypothetical protein